MKKNTMSILASSLAFVSCVVLSSVVFLGRDFSDDSGTKEVSGISVDSEGLLEIGTFPQSLVSEDCTWLIPQLDAIQWTNMRGFIEYDGEQYKRVVAHPDPYSPAAYFDDGTPIVDGQTYYFKVEPIKWRVLDEDTGMVLSDQVLEAQVFSSAMKYSNEWGYSTLRSYLNNIWYDYTFTAQEKASILLESHPFDTNFGATTSHTGDDDYVFLPSGTEYMDPNLGFSNTMSFDNSRRSATTEFARATGCSFFMSNTSRYWSRSGATGASVMCVSGEDGQFSSVLSNDATIGVRPALMIDTDVLAPTEIIGEYTRGDVVIDVSNSSDYDDPRGPVPFHFEILDETWTSIILTMWHEEIPAGYQFMINHDPLTVDLYISGPDEDHQFLPASDFGISSDVVSVSLIENDLCLTMDFTMTGGQTYLFYTTIEATNANNQGQIIEDYIYLSCNADWQKIVLDYLHGEVRVDENGRFTFFFELNESRQDWTKISYNLSPRGGNGTYITHEITKEASSINSWVEIRNGVTGIDFAAVMNVSGNVISLVMVGNNGMYPLDQMWDLNIIVYNNSYEVQRIRNELVLREYSPIVVYYTSDLVEMSTTALYNIYQFEFADLTWTKIDALFVSRGTNTAYVITINNDAEGNRVFYEVLRRTL
ncbi:MAG: DUF6273 domain-containing protein, partial [Erysipelotrichaceae bacterium]|nr:DUF6273 domain-containing protein [Erysipelotrichaceae bacterium]